MEKSRRTSRRKFYFKKKCPKGSISRKSYLYRKKGSKKSIRVKASCVKSKGLRSKGKKTHRVIPKLKKGGLTKYGYSVHESATSRHNAIKKALKAYGYSNLIKKLNAIKVLSKNTSPKNSRIYGNDIKYIQRISGSKSKSRRKSRKSKSRRKSRKSKSKRKSRRSKSIRKSRRRSRC